MSDTARAKALQIIGAEFIHIEPHVLEGYLDAYAAEQTAALRAALKTLIGQVEQARDGFGIWPYSNSASMALTLNEVRALLAAPEGR